MIALPAYSFLLGLLALLGYMAIAAGTKPVVNNATGKPDTNTIVPALFNQQFSGWFAGIAFAAIGIGALVPAAIMSIAAANLWTRNIYKEYLNQRCHPETGSQAGEMGVPGGQVRCGRVHPVHRSAVLHRPATHRRSDHPADAARSSHRPLHPVAALLGADRRLGGRSGLGALPALDHPESGDGSKHFGGSALQLGKLSIFGWHPFSGSPTQIYVGIVALVANLVVVAVVTLILRAVKVQDGADDTIGHDYHVDETDAGLRKIAAP